MQALSFAVHIPLVCFGIAFPTMVLFAEWLYLRTGDDLYRTLARRWTRVMVALFAVGVVTGTILSFEMGLLWPNFTGTFGASSGSDSRSRASRSSSRRSSSAIYVYGWDRLSARWHFASGVSDRHRRHDRFADGDLRERLDAASRADSAMRSGHAVDVHPVEALFGNWFFWHELVHMYIAGYIVTGFVGGGRLRVRAAARQMGPLRAHGLGHTADDRCPGITGAGPRRGLGGARGGPPSPPSSPPSRACRRRRAALRSTCSAGTLDGRVKYGVGIPKLLSFLAYHDPNARVQGLDAVPPDRPSAGERRPRRVPGSWSGSARCWRSSAWVFLCGPVRRRPGSPESRWFYRALDARGSALPGRADRGLGHHGGRPPAVGGVPGDAHQAGGDWGLGHPGWLRHARGGLSGCSRARPYGSCGGSRARRSASCASPARDRRASDAPLRPSARIRSRGASPSTWCSAARTSAPASGSSRRAAGVPASESATTHTTPWPQSGRPTTSGSSSCSPWSGRRTRRRSARSRRLLASHSSSRPSGSSFEAPHTHCALARPQDTSSGQSTRCSESHRC